MLTTKNTRRCSKSTEIALEMPTGGLFKKTKNFVYVNTIKISDSAYQSANIDEFRLLQTFLLLESLFLFLVKVDDLDPLLVHKSAFFDLEFFISLKLMIQNLSKFCFAYLRVNFFDLFL